MSSAFALPNASTRRAGRPRHMPASTTLNPRDEILDAAGRLFTTRGFAGTSTREIAEKVGIRQASLYYHFAGKDELLAALLERTLRPTLDQVDRVLALTAEDPPPTALYLLALVDIHTLATAPHNIGRLGMIPDVMSSPAAQEYAASRRDLLDAYCRLADTVIDGTQPDDLDRDERGELLLQHVENVIGLRAGGRPVSRSMAHAIASSCLRLCGVETSALRTAREVALERFDLFRAE